MRKQIALILLTALALPVITAHAQSTSKKMYRWVDNKGNVHYGDSVPPEYAKNDREVLNSQGIAVGSQQGEITAGERAEMAKKKADEDAERAAKAEVARRDRMLLQTYLSVEDIEDLRDRRLELLDSQIKVTELYLDNLRKHLTALQAEASNYKPYTSREDAKQIPAPLAADISRTAASINNYEAMLARTRADEAELRESFNADIARFRELKGG